MALPASVPEEPLTAHLAYTEPPVIDLHGLSVSFGRRQILKNLRGDLRGKAIGLLGPNGAGKTTLIHTLLGFHPPSAGTAQIFGHDINHDAKHIRSLIGYMPERDSFIAKMSAVHFVRLMGELSGLPAEAALERAHEALFYVGLGEARYRRLETYSLGMKQLAKLAQAIVHGPKLIFLDEPTNGLDPQGIQETRTLIRRLRDEFRLTVLMSSHLLTEVEQLCNRVGIIHDGRLLYEGRPDALLAPINRFKVRVDNLPVASELLTKEPGVLVSQNGAAFLRIETDADRIPAVNALLVANGINVYELTPIQESLEEAFLRLTKDGARL